MNNKRGGTITSLLLLTGFKMPETKKKALSVIAVCIPAIVSGFLAHWEASSEALEANKRAAAGYQVTRAAYEQMIKDVSALQAEMRLLRHIILAPAAPAAADYAEEEPYDMEEPAPAPAYEEDDDIVLKGTSGNPVRLKRGHLPDDLDMAQKILE